ncbi:MAG: kelch repeat-containing protein [Dokdonella sp.]
MTVPAILRLLNIAGFSLAIAVALAMPGLALALPGAWTAAGDLGIARFKHTSTLLPSGKVLVTGDVSSSATTDLYDPATNLWTGAASMGTGRGAASASVLPNGKVLVAGGNGPGNCVTTFPPSETVVVCYALGSAETYSPTGNTWSATGNLVAHRQGHTATLLLSGKVLIVGGASDCTTVTTPTIQTFSCTYLASAELYDPATNAWTAAGTLANLRGGHSAALLPSGKVLVAGGHNNNGILSSAELYDPANNTWSGAASLNTARVNHTATLLDSGIVYVAGGSGGAGNLASAELYNPTSDSWSAAANLTTSRSDHTATLLTSGKVLLAGGDATGSSASLLANPDVYDPASNTIAVQSSLIEPRYGHTATRLNSGDVLVTGGFGSGGELASAESFDPSIDTYTVTATASAHGSITPSTQIVHGGDMVSFTVMPGYGSSTLGVVGNTCGVHQVDAATWSTTAIHADCSVTASFLGPMSVGRFQFTATLLASGKVLIAGGTNSQTADLFDPVTKTWTAGGTMLAVRYSHTATLLPSGKVLVAGGAIDDAFGAALATTELYDPATNSWSAGGSMSLPRSQHVAAMLSTGKVLVTGSHNSGPVGHAELYNPATNTWSAAAAPQSDRNTAAVAVLSSGKVLLVGGYSQTTEIYDPVANAWSAGGNVPSGHIASPTATLLPSGKVLIAGGLDQNANSLSSTALYNPASNTWSVAASMGASRVAHTATLLGNGKVLVLAGYSSLNFAQTFLDSAESYDPAANAWTAATPLAVARHDHTSTLLPGGLILVAGGDPSGIGTVELYGSVGDAIFSNGFEP